VPLVIPAEQYRAVVPGVFSYKGQRSASAYLAAITQFPVTTHARYQRNAQGRTACNIFAWDVGVATNSPCPHWVDAVSKDILPLTATGIPIQKENRKELNGNEICDWLQTVGVQRYGWKFVTPKEAGEWASKGFMTVCTWFNAGADGIRFTGDDGIGHIGVIRPSVYPNLRMAQAGGSNFIDGTVTNGFGTNPVRVAQLVYLAQTE
jgi:hypothetical protein